MNEVEILRKGKIAIPIAAVALLVTVGWSLQNKLAADRAGEWITVETSDLVLGVEVTGDLQSQASRVFGPPQVSNTWNFKISMMAPEGDEVKTGQPILGFDTSELQQSLDEKKAEAESAAKQIEKTRADLVLEREETELALAEAEATLRKSALKLEAPEGVMSAQERKTVELDHSLAEQRVGYLGAKLSAMERASQAEILSLESRKATAEKRVAEIQDAMGEMMIKAPQDGTVVYITSRGDEKKKVGDSVWRMEKILEIPDLTKMIAKGEADESDAGKISLGQRVSFYLDAHPGVEFGGTVSSIARTVVPRSRRNPQKMLKIDIELDSTDTVRMRPGMRLRGTIELERKQGVVVVPREAVHIVGDKALVYRRGAFSVDAVAVEIGDRNGEKVEIVKGLEPGDRVLIQSAESGASQG